MKGFVFIIDHVPRRALLYGLAQKVINWTAGRKGKSKVVTVSNLNKSLRLVGRRISSIERNE